MEELENDHGVRQNSLLKRKAGREFSAARRKRLRIWFWV